MEIKRIMAALPLGLLLQAHFLLYKKATPIGVAHKEICYIKN
jgi:hypothetical protein